MVDFFFQLDIFFENQKIYNQKIENRKSENRKLNALNAGKDEKNMILYDYFFVGLNDV